MIKQMKVRIVSNQLLDVSNSLLEKFYLSCKEAKRWATHQRANFDYQHLDITDVYDHEHIFTAGKELKPVDFTVVLVPQLTDELNYSRQENMKLVAALGFLKYLTTDTMLIVDVNRTSPQVIDPQTHEWKPLDNCIAPVKYMWLKHPGSALPLREFGEEHELQMWHEFLGSRPQCADNLEYFGDLADLGLDYTYGLIHAEYGTTEKQPQQFSMSDFERALYKGLFVPHSRPELLEHHTFTVHLLHCEESHKQYVRLGTPEVPIACEIARLLYTGEKDFACFHDSLHFVDHSVEMDFDSEIVMDEVVARLQRTNAVLWVAKNADQLSLRVQFTKPLAMN